MIRSLLAASLALSLAVPGAGHRGGQSAPGKPLTLAQVWSLNAAYTDPQHGVSFRYPSAWKPATQFGYHLPALTLEDKPIAGFGYQEGGFPRQRVVGPYSATNLEGFGIVYAAAPAASAGACQAKAAALAETQEHRTLTFNGRPFTAYETAEGGMSQAISGNLYAAYVQPVCYLFETDVAIALPGALDGIPALTPAQSRSITAHLLDIMKSVRIAPPYSGGPTVITK